MVESGINVRSQSRPPVVAVLGHVDHGKTTLLDKIRQTDVAAREHGGITQQIGAYQIDYKGEKITFVDTPGHAAFEKMRSRGAEVADIALLVVAADDGVKPQTVEAIKHIKNSGAVMIVVISKIDLPNISLDKVKGELAKEDVLVESMGGDVVSVEVSAKTGKNIDKLLETILLVGQIRGLAADPSAPFRGVVIESSRDRFRGCVTSIVVKEGTVKVGDSISAGGVTGKVKALISSKGERLAQAAPATPVEVLGFEDIVPVGSAAVSGVATSFPIEPVKAANPLEMAAATFARKDKFTIVIKADVAGSLEAIISNLPQQTEVIASGTGEVTESDVKLAKISSSPILAFNAKLPSQVAMIASREGVVIKEYKVIYELLDDIADVVEGLSAEKEKESVLASAKITNEFTVEGQKIAGCKVMSGTFSLGDEVSVISEGKILGQTRIASLKQRAKNVAKVSNGSECGILFDPQLDFKIGDSVELVAQKDS